MPLTHRQVDAAVVVEISGRLAGRDSDQMESLVKDLLAGGGRKFVFDMSSLEYTDSMGVGAMVACLTRIRRTGGELRLACAKPRVQHILALTGVDKLVVCYPTVDDAVAG